MRLLTLVMLPLSAWASVDGDPISPYPGHANVWVDTTNDGVLDFRAHDDGLTFQLRAGAQVAGIIPSACLSAGTNIARGLRQDELTTVVGIPTLDGNVLVCPGVRFDGNIGGGWIQRRFHGVSNQDTPPMHYDGSSIRSTPVLVMVATLPYNPRPRIVASLSPDWVDVDWCAEWVFTPGARIEAGWTTISGDHRGTIDEEIAIQRRGWHVGFALRSDCLSYGIEFGHHEAIGRVGLSF